MMILFRTFITMTRSEAIIIINIVLLNVDLWWRLMIFTVVVVISELAKIPKGLIGTVRCKGIVSTWYVAVIIQNKLFQESS